MPQDYLYLFQDQYVWSVWHLLIYVCMCGFLHLILCLWRHLHDICQFVFVYEFICMTSSEAKFYALMCIQTLVLHFITMTWLEMDNYDEIKTTVTCFSVQITALLHKEYTRNKDHLWKNTEHTYESSYTKDQLET